MANLGSIIAQNKNIEKLDLKENQQRIYHENQIQSKGYSEENINKRISEAKIFQYQPPEDEQTNSEYEEDEQETENIVISEDEDISQNEGKVVKDWW